MKLNEHLIYDLLLATLMAGCILLSFRQCTQNKAVDEPITKIDTLYVRDTICVAEPKEKGITRVDTIHVPMPDTVRVHDTTFIVIEREQLTWRDDFCQVWASGILPSIDSVHHFTTTQIITRTETVPAPRWSVGFSVGPAAGVFYTPGGWQPGIGVAAGISFSWRFGK